MNILIPMAGPTDTILFNEVRVLKNLYKFNNEPFLKLFLKKLNLDGNLIFITQQEYDNSYNVTGEIESIVNNTNVIKLSGFEKGAALTILKIKDKLDLDSPIIISNSDYLINWDSKKFLEYVKKTECDGCLVTYESSSPKHSYCKVDNNGLVVEVAEKEVISSHANVGLYYWSSARLMIQSIESMVDKNVTYNGLYYISLSFNELIHMKKKILIHPVNNITIFDNPSDVRNIINEIY